MRPFVFETSSNQTQLANIRHLLPAHPAHIMLQIYSGLERQVVEEEDVEECDRLLTIFPNCPMIIGWKAHSLYLLKGVCSNDPTMI